MHAVTLKVDDSVYQKLMSILELFPKSKLKIERHDEPQPNKQTLKAIKEIEQGQNCESFSSAKDMFKAYGI